MNEKPSDSFSTERSTRHEAMRKNFRIIDGGKKTVPPPLDLTDLRRDTFLSAHYLERDVPREAEYHHPSPPWGSGDFPDAG